MTVYIALLRGINVGGTGKLVMQELVELCRVAGLKHARTYIQSGNVVFASERSEAKVKELLEKALLTKMGKPVPVMVRSREQLQAVLDGNPFSSEAPNKVLALFFDEAPAPDTFDGVTATGGEVVHHAGREVFVYYPNGIGQSKLKLPLVELSTGRNLNTIAKLTKLADEISPSAK